MALEDEHIPIAYTVLNINTFDGYRKHDDLLCQ